MAEAVELESFGRPATCMSFARAVQDFVFMDTPGVNMDANIPARKRPELERTVLVDVVVVPDGVFEKLARTVRVATELRLLGLRGGRFSGRPCPAAVQAGRRCP